MSIPILMFQFEKFMLSQTTEIFDQFGLSSQRPQNMFMPSRQKSQVQLGPVLLPGPVEGPTAWAPFYPVYESPVARAPPVARKAGHFSRQGEWRRSQREQGVAS